MSLNSNRAFTEAAKLPGRVLAPRAALHKKSLMVAFSANGAKCKSPGQRPGVMTAHFSSAEGAKYPPY